MEKTKKIAGSLDLIFKYVNVKRTSKTKTNKNKQKQTTKQ